MKLLCILTAITLFPLTAMDDSDSGKDLKKNQSELKKSIRINIPSSANLPAPAPLKRVDTMDALRQVKIAADQNPASLPSIDPEVAATIVRTLIYKTDSCEKSRLYREKLVKRLRDLEQNEPDNYRKIEQEIWSRVNKYDGDITAEAIERHRSRKRSASSSSQTPHSQRTPTSSSTTESPKHAIKSLMKNQSTLEQEVEHQEKTLEHQEKELEKLQENNAKMADDIKRMMGQLALDAAEDAQLSEQRRSNRIALGIGVAGVLVTTLSVLVTYYTSTCSSTKGSSGTNCTQ